MKHLKPILAVAIVMLAMAMPSISRAQYQDERLDNFINQRPASEEAAGPESQPDLRQGMARKAS